MSNVSVKAAISGLTIQVREITGGRSGIDQYNTGSTPTISEEYGARFIDNVVTAGSGLSAGQVLPLKEFQIREGIVWGIPVGSEAALAALATDDLRDNATVADDLTFPVGSRVTSLQNGFDTVPATAGAVFPTLVFYGTPASSYLNGVKVKVTTAGAAGTAQIACSTDGGTTWCTAYASVSGVNTVKDSSGADTGLRFRWTTGSLTTSDVATIWPGGAPKKAAMYLKTAPQTWTAL